MVVHVDGSRLVFPLIRFTTYKNLWFFSNKVCVWFVIRLSRVEGKTRLVDYVHSFFLLLNVRWSRPARLARLVFWPPPTAMLG